MPKVIINSVPLKGKPDIKVNKSLKPAKKGDPVNAEIERNEVVVGPLTDLGFPELYIAGGKPHSSGGTRVNLPENSFVFSKDKSMNIKNEDILKSFGKKPKKFGVDPAEIARQYDINKYLGTLVDPDVDHLQKETAEDMIKNYNNKLGKLALVQESQKGFPNSVPFISVPYLESMGMDASKLVHGSGTDQPEVSTVDEEDSNPQMRLGGSFKVKILKTPKMQTGGPTVKSKLIEKQNTKKLFDEMVAKNADIQASLTSNAQNQQNSQWLQSILDPQRQMENQELINQYAKTKQLQMTGQESSPWDFLPWINSAQEEQANFEDLAHRYGQDPNQLANKFEGNTAKKLIKKEIQKKTKSVSDTISMPEVRSFLQLGGDLPKYGDGGPVVQKAKDGSTKTIYSDGTYIIKNPKGIETRRGQDKVTPKSSSNKSPVKDNPTLSQNVGMEAYDPEEKAVLESIAPGLQVPQEVIPVKQSKKSAGGYGTFDQTKADKNWAWYGKKINWNNPAEVKTAQQAYNDHIKQKAIDAGRSETFANDLVKRVGFVDKKGLPNSLDSLAGGYTGSRIDFGIPQKSEPSIAQESPYRDFNVQRQLTKPEINYSQPNQYNPFWTQDKVNMLGATGDFYRIKKYLPWQSGYQTTTPTPTFYDPTRELAANSEQANIADQALGAFSGPQALSSRESEVQGNALENAANILGKYNNLNVGVANQFAANNANILNADSQNRGNMATNLYDKTVLTNQNFDNAKNMARQNMRQAYIQAITNRGQTQALNAVNKQYRVNPENGFVQFTGVPGKIDPMAQSKTIEDTFNNLMTNPHLKANPELAYKIALKSVGAPDDENFMQKYLQDYGQTIPK